MDHDIREKDWKTARSMFDGLLELAFERVIEKTSQIIDNNDSNAEKYHNLRKTLRDEGKQISSMFDDFKRSAAIQQISLWKHSGLLTDEQFDMFSPETQDRIKGMLKIWR